MPQVAVLNADNHNSGAGAAFVYSAGTIGNLGRLLSGADTSSRIWRVRLPNSLDLSLVTSVSGYEAP